jgi:hypothetical protein
MLAESSGIAPCGEGLRSPHAAIKLASETIEKVLGRVIGWRPCNGRTDNFARYMTTDEGTGSAHR